MHVSIGALTDRGKLRPGNEDDLLVGKHVFAVADGMGGHQAGEVASHLAVQVLAKLDDQSPWDDEATASESLRQMVLQANQEIHKLAQSSPRMEGMGTTITALLHRDDEVHLAHVGDSRAYLLREEQLTQLTEDHTLVQQLVRQGQLTPEEAARHPQRSVITRALGVESGVDVEMATFRLLPHDRLLLCTDGLSGPITLAQLTHHLRTVEDPQEAARRLVAAANDAGGPDNVTAIVIDITEDFVDLPSAPRPSRAGTNTADAGASSHTAPLPIIGSPSSPAAGLAGVATGSPSQRTSGGRFPLRERFAFLRPGPRTRVQPEEVSDEQEVLAQRQRRAARARARRTMLAGVVVLAALAIVVGGGVVLLSGRYFVGLDGEQVAIFRGIPGDVAGIRLSRLVERTSVHQSQIPTWELPTLRSGIPASSLKNARAVVGRLGTLAALDAPLPPATTPSASTTAPSTTARSTTTPSTTTPTVSTSTPSRPRPTAAPAAFSATVPTSQPQLSPRSEADGGREVV